MAFLNKELSDIESKWLDLNEQLEKDNKDINKENKELFKENSEIKLENIADVEATAEEVNKLHGLNTTKEEAIGNITICPAFRNTKNNSSSMFVSYTKYGCIYSRSKTHMVLTKNNCFIGEDNYE